MDNIYTQYMLSALMYQNIQANVCTKFVTLIAINRGSLGTSEDMKSNWGCNIQSGHSVEGGAQWHFEPKNLDLVRVVHCTAILFWYYFSSLLLFLIIKIVFIFSAEWLVAGLCLVVWDWNSWRGYLMRLCHVIERNFKFVSEPSVTNTDNRNVGLKQQGSLTQQLKVSLLTLLTLMFCICMTVC